MIVSHVLSHDLRAVRVRYQVYVVLICGFGVSVIALPNADHKLVNRRQPFTHCVEFRVYSLRFSS